MNPDKKEKVKAREWTLDGDESPPIVIEGPSLNFFEKVDVIEKSAYTELQYELADVSGGLISANQLAKKRGEERDRALMWAEKLAEALDNLIVTGNDMVAPIPHPLAKGIFECTRNETKQTLAEFRAELGEG